MNVRKKWLNGLIDIIVPIEKKLRRMQKPGITRDVDWSGLDAEQLTFAAPFFVLSTGRCGTLWLAEMLRMSKYAWVNSSDYPELIRHSRLAYEQYEEMPRVFCEIIRATRDEYIARAYRYGQIYVETNNRITFFSRAIKQVYPTAKFVHIVRHPGDFVRSGLNRKWYHGTQRHDLGRIRKKGSLELWQIMNDVEKIAWLWNETNQFIESFLAELAELDYVQVRVENMVGDLAVANRLCKFIGVDDIMPGEISKMLDRPINKQRKVDVDPYSAWPNSQKECVRRHAALAAHYEYEL